MKRYTLDDVYAIINKAIKKEMENKNRYIQLNGKHHKDVLNAFDNHIAALTYLCIDFKNDYMEG